jgi:hypothetical protein
MDFVETLHHLMSLLQWYRFCVAAVASIRVPSSCLIVEFLMAGNPAFLLPKSNGAAE